jgi:DNA-binding LytR/AlgR family response regulator
VAVDEDDDAPPTSRSGPVLRVLVADDEEMARRRLLRLLGALPSVDVVGTCADGEEVLARVAAGDVDVVLLDVHMPRLTGTEAMGLLGEDGPVVILTTAYPDYALEAFDAGVADYLLKPVEAAKLKRAIDRAYARIHPPRLDRVSPGPDRLALPTRRGIALLDWVDVRYACIDGASVVVHTTRGPFYTDLRLGELEERLPAAHFLRAHRKALVQLARIERLEDQDSGGYLAILDDGTKVAVSRQVARRLRRDWDLPR